MDVGFLCNKETMFSVVIKKGCVHCECYVTADSEGTTVWVVKLF